MKNGKLQFLTNMLETSCFEEPVELWERGNAFSMEECLLIWNLVERAIDGRNINGSNCSRLYNGTNRTFYSAYIRITS